LGINWAIKDNGVVRLLGPVPWPNGTKVTVIVDSPVDPPKGCNSPELYEILRRGYDTGETDAAARVEDLY
jgi:hypothetical protein